MKAITCGWLATLMILGLSGCASMHETAEPIPQIQPEQVRLADDIHLARDGWPAASWWTEYGDPQLDALIEQALSDSPTMEVVRSQVEQARARLGLVESLSRPQVMASASVNRTHMSASGMTGPFALNLPLLGLTGPWYTTGMIGVEGGYAFDIWGKERHQIIAAIGMQNAQLAEQAAVELEISTSVAQLYYGIQTTWHTIELLGQAREVAAATVEAHAARASRGLESSTPSDEARAQLVAVDRQLSEARSMIQRQREVLRALVGAHADNLPDLTPVPLPTSQTGLPTTLSYELLARRPDLQAMHWLVQASLSQVEVAKAAFYPSFDIKAFFGFTALHLSDLFRGSESTQFNLVPGLTLPIFTGGRLNANLEGAAAASNAAIAQYNQAVLNAVRDVAIAGAHLQGLAEEERLQNEKIQAVTVLQKSAEALHERGLANRITAMKARLPVIAEEISLLGIHGNQVGQSIALIKALGGGYQAGAGQPGDQSITQVTAAPSPAAAAPGEDEGM